MAKIHRKLPDLSVDLRYLESVLPLAPDLPEEHPPEEEAEERKHKNFWLYVLLDCVFMICTVYEEGSQEYIEEMDWLFGESNPNAVGSRKWICDKLNIDERSMLRLKDEWDSIKKRLSGPRVQINRFLILER